MLLHALSSFYMTEQVTIRKTWQPRVENGRLTIPPESLRNYVTVADLSVLHERTHFYLSHGILGAYLSTIFPNQYGNRYLKVTITNI